MAIAANPCFEGLSPNSSPHKSLQNVTPGLIGNSSNTNNSINSNNSTNDKIYQKPTPGYIEKQDSNNTRKRKRKRSEIDSSSEPTTPSTIPSTTPSASKPPQKIQILNNLNRNPTKQTELNDGTHFNTNSSINATNSSIQHRTFTFNVEDTSTATKIAIDITQWNEAVKMGENQQLLLDVWFVTIAPLIQGCSLKYATETLLKHFKGITLTGIQKM